MGIDSMAEGRYKTTLGFSNLPVGGFDGPENRGKTKLGLVYKKQTTGPHNAQTLDKPVRLDRTQRGEPSGLTLRAGRKRKTQRRLQEGQNLNTGSTDWAFVLCKDLGTSVLKSDSRSRFSIGLEETTAKAARLSLYTSPLPSSQEVPDDEFVGSDDFCNEDMSGTGSVGDDIYDSSFSSDEEPEAPCWDPDPNLRWDVRQIDDFSVVEKPTRRLPCLRVSTTSSYLGTRGTPSSRRYRSTEPLEIMLGVMISL
ncbi:hypothetical protein ON010_g5317 [Phytophthora cinnamomi]|nr:hypothetical protein ON010_g5317 [Phytophthora cinnamomi]